MVGKRKIFSRRGFLKYALMTVGGGIIGYFLSRSLFLKESVWPIIYFAPNLKDFTYIVGDAIYSYPGESPPGLTDISKKDFRGYSELWCNVNRRCIMVHNLAFFKLNALDANVGIDRKQDFQFETKLPYLPRASLDAKMNPQSVEAHISFYDGEGRYGKAKIEYVMGVQHVLNPWAENVINAWEDARWKEIAKKRVDTAWHKFRISISPAEGESKIVIDEKEYPVRLTKRYRPEWGSGVFTWIACETINAYPTCRKAKFIHYQLFRNISWIIY